MFNGTLRILIQEASDLRPTAFQGRLGIGFGNQEQTIDPYVCIDIDEISLHRYTWNLYYNLHI